MLLSKILEFLEFTKENINIIDGTDLINRY